MKIKNFDGIRKMNYNKVIIYEACFELTIL